MTDAPEKIWACRGRRGRKYWNGPGDLYLARDEMGGYIRLDLHEAAVAAARADGMRAMAAIAEDVIGSQNWTRGGVSDAAMEDMLGRIKASTPEAAP